MKGIAEEAFRWFIKNWFATVAERQTVGRHMLTCLPGRHPRAVGKKGRGRERNKLLRLYGFYHWVHFRITVDQSPTKSGPWSISNRQSTQTHRDYMLYWSKLFKLRDQCWNCQKGCLKRESYDTFSKCLLLKYASLYLSIPAQLPM